MPPVALIPVNRLDHAKGRLAAMLTPAEREALAMVTFRTVLDATNDAGFDVAVLTPDPRIAAALPPAVRMLEEREDMEGLNPRLEAAIATLETDELLILHADLPLARGGALRSLVAVAFAAPSVTVVESADGGTNAMLLRPPGRFPLAYGPGSAREHRTRALAAGLLPLTFGEPALTLDLDTADDLRRLLGSDGGRESAAGRLLTGFGIEARLAAAVEREPG